MLFIHNTIEITSPLQKKLHDCITSPETTSIDDLRACLLEGADPNGLEHAPRGKPELLILIISALQIMSMEGHTEKEQEDAYQRLALLIEFGADVNKLCVLNKFEGQDKASHLMPLSIAVRSGNERLFDTLMSYGANPHWLDQEGDNFLHDLVGCLASDYITTHQACSIAHRLIKLGVSVDQKKIFKPDDYLVQELLKKGIEKTEFTVEEHAATRKGCEGLVDFLRTLKEQEILTQVIRSQENVSNESVPQISTTIRL